VETGQQQHRNKDECSRRQEKIDRFGGNISKHIARNQWSISSPDSVTMQPTDAGSLCKIEYTHPMKFIPRRYARCAS
jgi:hypothetical protein